MLSSLRDGALPALVVLVEFVELAAFALLEGAAATFFIPSSLFLLLPTAPPTAPPTTSRSSILPAMKVNFMLMPHRRLFLKPSSLYFSSAAVGIGVCPLPNFFALHGVIGIAICRFEGVRLLAFSVGY